MLQIGQILNDTYRVDALLGEGGAGAVYVVFHLRMETRFALKVLSREGATPDLLTRFREEARLLASLDHPNIVRVIDWNSTPDGRPYLVMELLPGEDLAHFLARAGALPPAVAIPIVLQIADALQFVHDQGVVHRDLKPANVFLARNGPYPNFVKLLDFGIAKRLRAPCGLRTDRAQLIGTPAYMSPEQVTGGTAPVDARTDQFALGLIVYELLCGKAAFHRPGDELVVILTRVLTFSPPLLADPQFDAIIRRAIHKDPRARYASVHDFALALEAEQPRITDPSFARTTRIPKLTEAQLGGLADPDSQTDSAALPQTTYAHGSGERQTRFSASHPVAIPPESPASMITHRNGELQARARKRRLLQGALLIGVVVGLSVLVGTRWPQGGGPAQRPATRTMTTAETVTHASTVEPPPERGLAQPQQPVLPSSPEDMAASARPPRTHPDPAEGESSERTRQPDVAPVTTVRKVRSYRIQIDHADHLSRDQVAYISDCIKGTFAKVYRRFAGRNIELSRTLHLRVRSALPSEYADHLDDCLSRMSTSGLAVPAQARFQIVPVY